MLIHVGSLRARIHIGCRPTGRPTTSRIVFVASGSTLCRDLQGTAGTLCTARKVSSKIYTVNERMQVPQRVH